MINLRSDNESGAHPAIALCLRRQGRVLVDGAAARRASARTPEGALVEILLGDEELQMLDEDIEFYGWLEQQPEIRKGSDGVD